MWHTGIDTSGSNIEWWREGTVRARSREKGVGVG